MEAPTMDGHYGARVALDLCPPCGGIWFDGHESVTLTPGAVLRLFLMIDEHRIEARRPLPSRLACPRCRAPLALTVDRQRATRFCYWRCPHDHGRFITFAEFLREKNFVRPLSGAELAELRRNVTQVSCSSCGAPIDLAATSQCGYCRAPVSILDASQVEKVVADLKQAEERRQTVDPTLAARLVMDRLAAERRWNQLELRPGWDAGVLGGGQGIVETGVAALVRLLKGTAPGA
jgi:hypothetical protein